MTTTREQIFEALFALVDGVAGAKIERNQALPDAVPAAGLITQRDGDEPGDPIETVLDNPPVYTYEETVHIVAAFQNKDDAARRAGLDALIAAIGVQLATARTLGGLVQYAEPRAPKFEDIAPAGAGAIRVAAIPVRLTYDLSDPLA